MKIASVDSGTNSTALYAYNLSQKGMRKKVTEDNSEEIMTEIFFHILWKLWNFFPNFMKTMKPPDSRSSTSTGLWRKPHRGNLQSYHSNQVIK